MRVLATLLLAVLASSSTAQDTVWVTVRGTAWDSLRNAPLGGAFISIAGSPRTAVSDARGHFRIDSLSAGTHTFMMQHDLLDSIGFSGRSTRAAVDATHYTVTIAVPSFATLWRGLCGGAPPKDSGLVYGVVRDLSDKPLSGASVGVTWKDVKYRRSTGFDWKDMGGQTTADSSGRYALCGVPVDIGLGVAAAKDSLVSAPVDLAPLTLRISRRDLRVAPKGGASGGTGIVMGVLTAKGGAPLANAIVAIDGVPDVRSGEDGRFVLHDVPAGTRQVEVRAVGAAPVTSIIDVTPRDTTSVTLEMGRVQTLEVINVKAQTFAQVMVRNINERKMQGLGYVRDSSDFAKLALMSQAMDGIAGLKVGRGGGTAFKLANTRPGCALPLAIWIDRARLDESVLASMRPDEVSTIEVYLGSTTTPPEFMTPRTCGAVVVWTKRFLRLGP